MLFSSAFFLFGFLPVFFIVYLLTPRRGKNLTLFGASLFFYAWAEPRFVFWALASALLDYALGFVIVRRHSKAAVALGVTANLALLVWFKYANFFADTLAQLFGRPDFALGRILLPIAISFIVFEKITYLVDLYRGEGRPAPDVLTYLLYVFYFPKLLAGPIIRYRDIDEQLLNHRVTFEGLRDGTVRFLWGLAKKTLLADCVGNFATKVFDLPPDQLNGASAWLGVLCFTAQIYLDFSAYSDMAIGLSRAMGFRLNENFNLPYTSANFTEFWRRWHISLSTWIREYLYIPLGGNRVSKARSYFNLCVCFLLSGLWHGAAWNFIVWGLFHGAMLIADRAFWLRAQQRLPRLCNVALTFFLVMMSWVIFRAKNFSQMTLFFERLFTPGQPDRPNMLWFSPDIAVALGVCAVISFFPLLPASRRWAEAYRAWRGRPVWELATAAALLLVASARVATATFNAFIYFRF